MVGRLAFAPVKVIPSGGETAKMVGAPTVSSSRPSSVSTNSRGRSDVRRTALPRVSFLSRPLWKNRTTDWRSDFSAM
jgi:hypothetical protein